jgi:hypothetical protein
MAKILDKIKKIFTFAANVRAMMIFNNNFNLNNDNSNKLPGGSC